MAKFKTIKNKTYFLFNPATITVNEAEYSIGFVNDGLDIYSNEEGLDNHVIIDIEDEILEAIKIIRSNE
jgi:hypothetical protein